jgi:alanyl-tRNA synthetase
VQQKGSLVDREKTRFDFVHHSPLTRDEILKIEQIVNAEILQNSPSSAKSMDIESAKKTGAMMLFGEKYAEEVRVLEIGSSKELCGGTHVVRTGDIGLFKIISESGVAAGIRRVEAITGENALDQIQKLDLQMAQLAAALKTNPQELPIRVQQLQDQVKGLEKELERLKSKMAASQGEELLSQVVIIKQKNTLVARLDGLDVKALRETLDQVKNKLHTAVIVLATIQDDKVQIIAGVTQDLIAQVKAGELVNFVAQQVGGKGGGKPDMAMAGGTLPQQLPQALASVGKWLEERL